MQQILTEWRKYLVEAKKHHFIDLATGSDEWKRFNKEQERLEKEHGGIITPTQLHGYPDNHPDLIDLPANRKYKIPGTNNWLILLEPDPKKEVPSASPRSVSASPRSVSEPAEHPQAGDLPPMAPAGEHTIERKKIKRKLKKLKMPEGRIIWRVENFSPEEWKALFDMPWCSSTSGCGRIPDELRTDAWSWRFKRIRAQIRGKLTKRSAFTGWRRLTKCPKSNEARCWEKDENWTLRYDPKVAWADVTEGVEGLDWYQYDAFLRKISKERWWYTGWYYYGAQSFFRWSRLGSPSLNPAALQVIKTARGFLPKAPLYLVRRGVTVWHQRGLKTHKKRRKLKRRLKELEGL